MSRFINEVFLYRNDCMAQMSVLALLANSKALDGRFKEAPLDGRFMPVF